MPIKKNYSHENYGTVMMLLLILKYYDGNVDDCVEYQSIKYERWNRLS